MGNFFDSGVKEKFIEHLKSIDENSKPLWGVMNAAQMIKHLDITYKMALGEIKAPDDKLKPLLSTNFGKWVMIKQNPWLKNMATAKSLIVHEMIDLETIKEDIFDTFERFSTMKETETWGTHPIFGKLNKSEWGQLQYKHTMHHLKQFGV